MMRRSAYIRRSVIGRSGKLLMQIRRSYSGPWGRASVMASFDQDSYAFYQDGSESGSTQVGTTNNQTTLEVNTTYGCRLLVQEANGAAGTARPGNWQYNHNSGGWVNITTISSVVKAVDSASLTDEGDTTQRIGSGTFVTPNAWVCEDGVLPNLAYGASEECEGLLAFQIIGADVSHGDEILIRFSGVDSWTRDADIDVNKPAASRRIFVIS
jgi:hypothetical protein